MSHVATVKTRVRNLPALQRACDKLGLEFREGQTTWRWFGSWVDDYHGSDAGYRNGIKPEEYGLSDHAIAVKGRPDAYEVGVVKQDDGFALVWDFFGGGRGLMDIIGDKGHRLTQEYSAQVVEEELNAANTLGYPVERTRVANGDLQIAVEV